MLTYVIRRLLYSVVVLIAASFIIFTFVSLSNDPLAFLKMQPNASQETIENITERKHLDEPIPVQYLYWAKDALTNQFGTTTIGDRPILPELTRVMGHTLQLVIVAELLAVLIAVFIVLPDMGVKVSFFGTGDSAPDPRVRALVPRQAVREVEGKQAIFRYQDGRLAMRTVTVGSKQASEIEIIEGISPGDSVVVSGPANLKDGLRVMVKE